VKKAQNLENPAQSAYFLSKFKIVSGSFWLALRPLLYFIRCILC